MTSYQNKKILITGGLGFIGSSLAEALVKLGAEVTIYDLLDPKSGGNLQNIEGFRDQVKLILSDIRNFEALCAAVINQEVIFNCAAYTSHPNSMREPLVDIEINCKGTIHLLEAVRRFSPSSRIVHVGTSTQIGKMHTEVIDELHPEFPMDIYSANKSASEKYVLLYGKVYAEMDTCVVRLANTYGPRSNIRSPDFGFINYFIGLGLAQKEITVFGSGKQLRNVSFISDSVEALLLAGAKAESRGEVFFAVSDKQISVAEIASGIAKIIGGTVKHIDWPKEREAIEVGDAIISNAKIKKTLAWEPKVDYEPGLVITSDYFSPVLKKYL
jgi:UDP-glucose 4-epimerase